MPPKGKTGVPTGGMEYSPQRRKRRAQRRKAEDKRWAALAGPVVVSHIAPEPEHDVNEVNQPPADAASDLNEK